MGPLVVFLPTPSVPPPTVSELPVLLPVYGPLALMPVSVAEASLLVLADAEPPVLPPVAVSGASLLLHFPLLVAVDPLLLMSVACPGVSRSRWLLAVL